jgi:hypothetical protein
MTTKYTFSQMFLTSFDRFQQEISRDSECVVASLSFNWLCVEAVIVPQWCFDYQMIINNENKCNGLLLSSITSATATHNSFKALQIISPLSTTFYTMIDYAEQQQHTRNKAFSSSSLKAPKIDLTQKSNHPGLVAAERLHFLSNEGWLEAVYGGITCVEAGSLCVDVYCMVCCLPL